MIAESAVGDCISGKEERHAPSECSPVFPLCRWKLLGMLTFGPELYWTFLLAALGGSKAT